MTVSDSTSSNPNAGRESSLRVRLIPYIDRYGIIVVVIAMLAIAIIVIACKGRHQQSRKSNATYQGQYNCRTTEAQRMLNGKPDNRYAISTSLDTHPPPPPLPFTAIALNFALRHKKYYCQFVRWVQAISAIQFRW